MADEIKVQMSEAEVKEILDYARSVKEVRERGELTAGKQAEMEQKLNGYLERLDKAEADYKRAAAALENRGNMGGKTDWAQKGRAIMDQIRLNTLVQANSGKAADFRKIMEQKAYNTSDLTMGGAFTWPTEFMREVIDQAVVEVSPIRQIARISTTSGNSQMWPTVTAHPVASQSTESGTRTADTTLKTGKETVLVHDLDCVVQVTFDQLEDSAFDFASFLQTEMVNAIADLEASKFVNGSGAGEAEGFMTKITTHIAQGEASTMTNPDALIKLPYQLKDKYGKAGVYVMKRSTLGNIMSLRSSAGGYYMGPLPDKGMWQIHGFPIYVADDMPAIGAGEFPVIFGDFKNYLILDKAVDYDLIIDPYSGKKSGYVEYMLRRRVGGQVLNTEAFVKLEIAAS